MQLQKRAEQVCHAASQKNALILQQELVIIIIIIHIFLMLKLSLILLKLSFIKHLYVFVSKGMYIAFINLQCWT